MLLIFHKCHVQITEAESSQDFLTNLISLLLLLRMATQFLMVSEGVYCQFKGTFRVDESGQRRTPKIVHKNKCSHIRTIALAY